MEYDRLVKFCQGKSYSTGGYNISDVKKFFPELTKDVNSRQQLIHILCEDGAPKQQFRKGQPPPTVKVKVHPRIRKSEAPMDENSRVTFIPCLKQTPQLNQCFFYAPLALFKMLHKGESLIGARKYAHKCPQIGHEGGWWSHVSQSIQNLSSDFPDRPQKIYYIEYNSDSNIFKASLNDDNPSIRGISTFLKDIRQNDAYAIFKLEMSVAAHYIAMKFSRDTQDKLTVTVCDTANNSREKDITNALIELTKLSKTSQK